MAAYYIVSRYSLRPRRGGGRLFRGLTRVLAILVLVMIITLLALLARQLKRMRIGALTDGSSIRVAVVAGAEEERRLRIA